MFYNKPVYVYNMICNSTHSNDYACFLIVRGIFFYKDEARPETKFLLTYSGRSKKMHLSNTISG